MISKRLITADSRTLTILIIVVLLVPLVGAFGYVIERATIERRQESQLAAIAADRVNQVGHWRAAVMQDAARAAASISALLGARTPTLPRAPPIERLLQNIVDGAEYKAGFVFDPSLALRAAVADVPHSVREAEFASGAIKTGAPVLGFGRQGEPYFIAAVPIVADRRVVGAFVLRIDPQVHLYPSLLSWPIPGETAEIVLVDREGSHVMFLSRLRFLPGREGMKAPMTSGGLVAATAASGREGYITGRDYRGVEVIAALRKIPGSSWAVIAKIDRSEALAPIRELALWSLFGSLLLTLLAASVASLWWRHRRLAYQLRLSQSEQERLALERHYDYLAKYANDVILLADAQGRLVEANDRALQIYRYPRDQLLRLHWGDLTKPGELPDFTSHWEEVADHDALIYEIHQRRADGTVFPAEVSARIIEVEDKRFYQAIIRDITERKASEAKINRLTQLYAVISHTNAAIMRATGREQLFSEVCHIAVVEGLFAAAWMSEVDKAASKIRRVIACGERQGPAELSLPITPFDPIAEALGLALSEDEVRIVDRVGDEVAKRWDGIRSLAVLPLKCEGEVIGLLAVCAGEPGFLDAQLTRLLREMAGDISYGLDNLAREAKRQRAEQSLRESERRYRQLFDGTNSGVAVYEAVREGEDFVITDINPAVERFERVRKNEIVGKSIQEVFPGVREFGLFDVLQRVWRTGRSEHFPAAYYEDPRHSGWRENEVYRLPTGEVVAVYEDVTERILAAQALRENAQRLALVLDGSSDGFWDWDVPGQHIYFSPRYAGILGYEPDELEPNPATLRQLIHPDDLPATWDALDAHQKGLTERLEIEHRMRTKSGQWRWIFVRGKIVERDVDGKPLRMSGAISDISQRREAEEQRRLWSRVFEDSQDAIVITDANRRIITVNRAFSATTGYEAQDVHMRDPGILRSRSIPDSEYEMLWNAVEKQGAWKGEIEGQRRDGRTYPAWLSITAVRDPGGAVANYIGIFSDISERKAAEERIRFLSHHDLLTGLPNRALLHERAARALALAKENQARLALLLVDVDRFKSVNDRFGERVADGVLSGVAQRLTEAIGLEDSLGRQGGDQFAVLLSTIASPADPAHVAEGIMSAMTRPFPALREELLLTCSIGIAVFPEDGETFESLLTNAEAALRYAKELGRGNYQFFAPEVNVQASEWLALENDLRWAMERSELFLDYQPQFDVISGKLVGVEALVRWRHSTRGIIPPAKFIPLAEESGLVVRMGEWVLREACRQQREWQRAGLPAVPVAVNISAVQFAQKNFDTMVAEVLKESHLSPAYLELEVTETVVMKNPEETAKTLRRLKETGISIAIDDFGTGYSSLSYLQQFPIDRLKIDRSFVTNMVRESANRVVTESVIGLGKNLGLRVIAEGVETEEEMDLLRVFACNEVQGYLFSRPLSADAFLQTTKRQHWR